MRRSSSLELVIRRDEELSCRRCHQGRIPPYRHADRHAHPNNDTTKQRLDWFCSHCYSIQFLVEPIANLKSTGSRFTWQITGDDALPVQWKKGELFESIDFALEGIDNRFRLRFWPAGLQKAKDGFCSAFVWAKEAADVPMYLAVDGVRR